MAAIAILLAVVPFFGWSDGQKPTPEPSGKAQIIDVSSHQGSINWQAVADSGIQGVYHKLSEGKDYRDPSFSNERRLALKENNIPWGFYHFVRPKKRPAALEARWFTLQAKNAGGWGAFLPAIDVEVTELSARATGNYVADLIFALRQRGVSKMLLYASPGWWRENVAITPKLKSALRFTLPWIAHWGVANPEPLLGTSGYVLHQYTSSGRVPGISGGVDLNNAPEVKSLFRKKG